MKRLFIATRIGLNEPFLAWRTRFQHEMRHDDIVWVKEEVRHLTLRFLGSTPDSKIDVLKSTLEEVCGNHTSFRLEINKLGVFGSHYHPEVLWLGFSKFDLFKEVHLDLEPRLQTLGFEPYYGNFVPHITLGRVKSVVNKKKFWERFVQSQPDFTQMISVCEFTLYQSFLHKDGPEYKALASYPLKPSTQ